MSNPYLKPGRLPDVIAAITAMASYKFYKLDFEGWANRISGPGKAAEHWRQVFLEHPEFFRLSSEGLKASLVWRRVYPRNFDVDDEAEVAPDHQLGGVAYDRISRRPLQPDEITALMGVAIDLHERAIEQQKAGRWWLPLLVGALAFVGSVLGAWISSG